MYQRNQARNMWYTRAYRISKIYSTARTRCVAQYFSLLFHAVELFFDYVIRCAHGTGTSGWMIHTHTHIPAERTKIVWIQSAEYIMFNIHNTHAAWYARASRLVGCPYTLLSRFTPIWPVANGRRLFCARQYTTHTRQQQCAYVNNHRESISF